MSIPWLRPPEFDQSRETLSMDMSQYDSKAGVLLVGHGTRSAVGAAQFLALAGHLSREFAPMSVEPAFLELRQPDVGAAVEALIGRGISRLLVVPLMLFTAGHVKRDVPQAVQAALLERGYAQLEVAYADDLGCDPAIVEASSLRTEQAVHGQSTLAPRDCCLLLVGRGSSDLSATAEMHRFVALRQEDSEMQIQVAFLAKATPSFVDVLPRLGNEPYRRIIVQPHLLFEGELSEKIARQVSIVAQKSENQEWILTPVLADPPDQTRVATHLLQKVIRERCLHASIRIVVASGRD